VVKSESLYLAGAALMLLDAVGYSFGALRQLHKGLAPRDPYLSRSLLLNLMLANAGLYFTAAFAFVGALATPQAPTRAVMMVALAACLYSILTVPWLTPEDWGHSIPRGVAALAIVMGLILY